MRRVWSALALSAVLLGGLASPAGAVLPDRGLYAPPPSSGVGTEGWCAIPLDTGIEAVPDC
jgi:hypothetical protein